MAGIAASFSTNMSCRVAVGFAASAFFVVNEPANEDTMISEI